MNVVTGQSPKTKLIKNLDTASSGEIYPEIIAKYYRDGLTKPGSTFFISAERNKEEDFLPGPKLWKETRPVSSQFRSKPAMKIVSLNAT